LTHNRTRRLVVDVEVAGGVAQCACRFANGRALACEHGAGQGIRRRAVDEAQRLGPGAVAIHIRGDDRTEDLLAQQAIPWIRGLDQRRLDEVAGVVLGRSTLNDRRVPPRVIEVTADLRKRFAVDDGAHERAEINDVSHLHLAHHRDDPIAQLRPQRLRDVDAAGG
jgi:hypothetical protein